MKSAAHATLSAFVAAVVHLTALELLRIVFYGTEGFFTGLTASAWFFAVGGCILCYLPALLTGLILGRVNGLFRPSVTVPVGVMVFWTLFLGCGAMGWPSEYWTPGRENPIPWLLDYWGVVRCFPSLFVLLSTGLVARLGVDWRFSPQQETEWLWILLVLCNAVAAIAATRYFLLPQIDHDEAEQAHVLWALSQGVIPYRDIHQIHTPLLWMLAWPIMHWLPHTFEAVLALRSACAAALIGSYIAGLLILREILGTGSFFGHRRPKNVPVPLSESKGTVPALLLLLLVLAVVPDFQLYLFRPDPFMTLCSAWAILAAVRMRRAPARYAQLCGIALGLGVSFSIRLSWLCLLIPIVAMWECVRQRALRPLWLVLPNAAGFVLGILPVAVWLAYQGVFSSFWTWGIVANSSFLGNPFDSALPNLLFIHRAFAALALLGGCWLLWSQRQAAQAAWSPAHSVLVGAILAWSVPVTGVTARLMPFHYPFQVTMIPGAVLGAVFLAGLLAWVVPLRGLRIAALATTFACIVAQEPPLNRPGLSVAATEFRQLQRLCSAADAKCVCFAPWHPIFCRDAADLYLWWDEGIAACPMFSHRMRNQHRQLWPAAIAAIEKGIPDVIGDHGVWDAAYEDGVIDDEQYDRFQRAVEKLYDRVDEDGWLIYTRKKDLGSRAQRE